MGGSRKNETHSPKGYQKQCVKLVSGYFCIRLMPSSLRVPTSQAGPDLCISAFQISSLSTEYDLKTINDIDLIDIPSPFFNGKIPPHFFNQMATPVVEKCRYVTTRTDAPASTQNKPSQSSSGTENLLEHQPHLVVDEKEDPNFDNRLTPPLDYGSTSHRSLEGRLQLCQWLNETSNFRLTVTERLERSKWEPDGSKSPQDVAMVCRLRELSDLVSM